MTRSEGLGPEVKRRILMVTLLLRAPETQVFFSLLTTFTQGSYALSAGHSDAYYKRAQEVTYIMAHCTHHSFCSLQFSTWHTCHIFQVQRIVGDDLASKLSVYDALISPAAPTPAYGANDKVLIDK